MPIRPENKHKYGPIWTQIKKRIRFERAGGRCEQEGCGAIHGQPHPISGSKVVITTAHLDHDETNQDEGNLRAMCMRCHLAYDREDNQRRRREYRQREQQLLQPSLLEEGGP